jgi:phenylpyruvate tautomerase PptA (4-oxalocrotonate tautomerase family)
VPIIDLTLPRDALPPPVLAQLSRDLSRALLRCDVSRDNPRAEGINWVYVHQHPPEDLLVGGRTGGRPHYRVDVTIMAGAMSEDNRREVAQLMTQAVLAAEGGHPNTLNAGRVWVLFHEVADGYWAAGGRLYRLADVMRFVTGGGSSASTESAK